MHEQAKLREAEYFLRRMAAEQNDPVAFDYELSAFLTSARSVLMYAYAEAKPQPGGLRWYDGAVKTDASVLFFRDKRDVSVHHEPLVPARDVDIVVSDGAVLVSEMGVAVIVSESGGVKTAVPMVPAARAESASGSPATVKYRHRFADWSGPEDIPTLGRRYLDALYPIVQDGVRRGFLTP